MLRARISAIARLRHLPSSVNIPSPQCEFGVIYTRLCQLVFMSAYTPACRWGRKSTGKKKTPHLAQVGGPSTFAFAPPSVWFCAAHEATLYDAWLNGAFSVPARLPLRRVSLRKVWVPLAGGRVGPARSSSTRYHDRLIRSQRAWCSCSATSRGGFWAVRCVP